MDLTVKNIERIWVDVPFRKVPRRNMIRELPHWTIFEICRVTLACGVEGLGETMVYYTWGAVSEEAEQRAMGRCASELMWDDSLGAGLQMALFDAVAKALEVPIHHLLGKQVRDEAFISWWSIDMPPEDWKLECRDALAAGYTSYKFKARPWFDLHEQLQAVIPEVPPHFDIDLDFNTMLNNSATAVRFCKSLEQYEQIKILESPIPQGDVAGNKYLRAQTSIPLAMHVGNPPLATALKEDVCDGFVVCAGASQVLHESQNIAAHNKMFWLQLVGTGITTTWGLHLAAVSSHARWPAISCQNLYEHTLLKKPLEIKGGMIDVPNRPGLGVELDWDMIEKFRIDPIAKPYPYPDLLMELTWPSGQTDDYAHGLQYWHEFLSGLRPVFSPNVMLKILPNDGSTGWQERYNEAMKKPSWDMRPN